MSLPLYTLSSQTNGGSDYCNTENEEDTFFLQDKLSRCAHPRVDSHPLTVFLSSVDLHISLLVPDGVARITSYCLLAPPGSRKEAIQTDHRLPETSFCSHTTKIHGCHATVKNYMVTVTD